MNLNIQSHNVSCDNNPLIQFKCGCSGEIFFSVLVIAYECSIHKGMTTANRAICENAYRIASEFEAQYGTWGKYS